jgi:hypothetical protein
VKRRGGKSSAFVAVSLYAKPNPLAGRRRREVRWVRAQVAQQPKQRQHDDGQCWEERGRVGWLGVLSEGDDEHEASQRDEGERDHPMEPSRFRMRPRVDGTNDLAPAIRIGAPVLRGTGVAHVRAGTVANEAPLPVELVRPEVLAFCLCQ